METQLRISLTEIYIVKLQTVFLVQIFVSAQSGKIKLGQLWNIKNITSCFHLTTCRAGGNFIFFL